MLNPPISNPVPYTANHVILIVWDLECPAQNKDHQRMMEFPIFMIVQNLRLFLTAFTPTAVAPAAVIL